MKTLYIQCLMGATEETLAAALLELLPDAEDFCHALNQRTGAALSFEAKQEQRQGVLGTRLCAEVKPGIAALIPSLPLSDKTKANMHAVQTMLEEAAGAVGAEGITSTDRDTAFIALFCLLMEQLAPNEVIVSPIHTGGGLVMTAHGMTPVPTPTTACILKGVPCYGGSIEGELCTAAGAALLKHFAVKFGDMPVMTARNIGYGLSGDDDAKGYVRAFWGETGRLCDEIVELSCNVDDMTGENVAFALETLMREGALDAYVNAVQMKKNRPGQVLRCLAKPEDEFHLAGLLLQHTSAFGVRVSPKRRYVLERRTEQRETRFGLVHIKVGQGYGIHRRKVEFDDIARLALEHGMTIPQLRAKLEEEIQ